MDNLELMIENYDYRNSLLGKSQALVIIILNHQF